MKKKLIAAAVLAAFVSTAADARGGRGGFSGGRSFSRPSASRTVKINKRVEAPTIKKTSPSAATPAPTAKTSLQKPQTPAPAASSNLPKPVPVAKNNSRDNDGDGGFFSSLFGAFFGSAIYHWLFGSEGDEDEASKP